MGRRRNPAAAAGPEQPRGTFLAPCILALLLAAGCLGPPDQPLPHCTDDCRALFLTAGQATRGVWNESAFVAHMVQSHWVTAPHAELRYMGWSPALAHQETDVVLGVWGAPRTSGNGSWTILVEFKLDPPPVDSRANLDEAAAAEYAHAHGLGHQIDTWLAGADDEWGWERSPDVRWTFEVFAPLR